MFKCKFLKVTSITFILIFVCFMILITHTLASQDKLDFSTKPIVNIIPAQPGGGWDTASRAITPQWEKIINSTFQYEYLTGAGTVIAMTRLTSLPPDGHAVMWGFISYTANTLEFQKPPHISWDDIAFLGNVISDADALIVRADDNRWSNANEFIEYARKAKDSVIVSVSQPLAPAHLIAEIFKELSGANIEVLPFDGGSAARNALAGGHVDASIGALSGVLPMREQLKVIGVFADQNPVSDIWDCPTISESVDFDMPNSISNIAVHIRKDTIRENPEVFDYLVKTFKEAIMHPDTQESLKKQDYLRFVDYLTPEECDEKVIEYNDMMTKYGYLIDPSKQ